MLNYLSEIKHENTPGGKLMDKFQQLTVDDALEIIRYWESLGNVNTYVGKSI